MFSRIKFIIIGVGLSAFLAGCNLPSRAPDAAATLQAVYTSQAATVQALQTLAYAPRGMTSTPLPTGVFPTLPPVTAFPTASPLPPLPPSLTPLPPTIPPTRTPVLPTKTQTIACDWAAFVKDISIPDGSIIEPGAHFTKTWRLKNIGSCTWTTSYGLVFLRGNNMNGVATTKMPKQVKPGQSVDISIELTAPTVGGSHRGYFLLRNKAGAVFGLGKNASEPFYVDIKVPVAMVRVLDFASSYCSATWRSETSIFVCSGNENVDLGFVRLVQNPQLENGKVFAGSGLLMAPEKVRNGYLQGYYPSFLVENGDRFRAVINCKYLAKGCDVAVRLDYQIDNGPVKNIWRYDEVYDGQYRFVDTDLSFLTGKSVSFILTVLANGSPEHDRLLWADPRIVRFGYLVTPSPQKTLSPTDTGPGATPNGN